MLILLCAAAAGALLHDAHFRHLPGNHIARYVGDERAFATVTGQIVTTPRLVPPPPLSISGILKRPPRTKFVVAVEQAEGAGGPVELTGLLEVSVAEPVFDLYSGNRVRLFGNLYKPSPPNNPGQFDWALAKRRQGIHAGLSFKYAEAIEKLAQPGSAWRRWQGRLRLEAKTLLFDDVLENQLDRQALIGAMLLGQRSQLDPQIYEVFRRTGTAHFFALSGMHVGLLASMIWLGGRLIGLSRRSTAVLVLAALTLYAILAEPRPSAIRATVIAVALCIGLILRRPANTLNSISLAAICLLVWNPLQLFQAGFQLSFVVVFGIIYLTPVVSHPLVRRLWSRDRMQPSVSMARKIGVAGISSQSRARMVFSAVLSKLALGAVFTLCMSLAAWLAGAPIVAVHFNTVFSFGWPFTFLVFPFVSLVMFSGFTKLLFGLAWPSTAVVLGPVLELSVDGMVWVVQILSKVPKAMIDVPAPAYWWLALYYGFLLALVFWRSAKVAALGRIGFRWPALLGTATLLTAIPAFLGPVASRQLRITALAVGPGSATIIELPSGRTYLYDAGSLADYDSGRVTVMPALRQRGIRNIQGAIISHANFDHYSSLFSLFELVNIERVWVSPHFAPNAKPGEPDRFLLEEISRRRIDVALCHSGSQGKRLSASSFGAVETEILWPPVDLPSNTAVNDTSLVIRLSYANHSVLLTGDIDQHAQERLLASGTDLHADVLFLPHHGSVNSATAQFVQAVRPQYVIRSGARRAGKMHEALGRIVTGYRYFDTAQDGAITITLGAQELSVQSFLSPDRAVSSPTVRE